jgi:hypothetical protein
MPVHVTTDTAQTITGNKTFTGSVSTSSGFTFPDGKTQTIAFTGVTIPPSDRLNNGNVQIVLSSDNNLHFPTGTIGDTLSDGGFTIVGKPGYYAELASHDGNVFAWVSDANYGNPAGGGFSIGTDTTDLSGGYIWTFGNDGLLHFPDGSIQSTAFTNNLSAYAGLNYVNNNFLNLSGGALTGAVSTTNVLYTTGGNSNQWNSSYSTLQTQSANNLSVYSTVNTYSATTWNPAGRYLPLSGGTLTGTLSVGSTRINSDTVFLESTEYPERTMAITPRWIDFSGIGISEDSKTCRLQHIPLLQASSAIEVYLPNQAGRLLTDASNLDATKLTGTIANARLPVVMTGLSSVTSNAFVGGLSGTASGNLPLAGGTLTGTLTINGFPVRATDGNLNAALYANRLEFEDKGGDSDASVSLVMGAGTPESVTISLPTQSGQLLTNVSNLSAANLTGTIANARLPTTMAGLSSVASTTFIGSLSGTASNNLPLSGGTVTGATRFDNNVTIFGNLSCSGTQTFQNTIFSTTSAVSVVHTGDGPALWVGNNGTGDIASFYDIDASVEVLHVGGNNGTFPNVGVKTSTPNVDFTVNGAISASSVIYSLSGNSNQWNSAYSTVQTYSATNWNYQGTDIKALTGNWQASYTALTSTSANWNDTRNTVQAYSATTWNYQGTDIKALTGNWQASYTALTSTSANWNDTRSIVQTNSGTNWNYQGTDIKALTGNWQNTYATVSTQSANNLSVYSTVNSYSATTWNPAGRYLPLSGGTLTGGLSVNGYQISVNDQGSRSATLHNNRLEFENTEEDWSAYLYMSSSTPRGTTIGLPNQSGQLLADTSNLPAAKLTGTIANARLPVVMSGLSSVASTTFIGSLSGTASGNLPLSGGTVTGVLSTTNVIYASGGNSNQWNTAYSTVQTTSGSWNPAGSYLPLSGGTLTGPVGVTDGGDQNSVLTQSSLTITDANNPGQNASFNINSVGIGDGTQNSTLNSFSLKLYTNGVEKININADGTITATNSLSTTNVIYASGGNSDQWNSAYSTVQTASGTWGGTGGSFAVEDANTIIGLSMFL